MALIKCPECGKEISDKASACIHCGYPLANTQKKVAEKISSQPSNSISNEKNNISKGFSIVSLEENTVGLQCENCARVSQYIQNRVITKISEKEWITNNVLTCPNCKNTMQKGMRIKLGKMKQVDSHSEERNTNIHKQDDNSGAGCLGWLIAVGVIDVIGMFLLTDGFSDFALWWLVFPLTFAALLIVGMIYSFATSDPKEVKQNWDREKYNDYKFTCPMCGSKKVKKIGTMNRAASVATVGLASSKIGKQYECDDCKHKW